MIEKVHDEGRIELPYVAEAINYRAFNRKLLDRTRAVLRFR